MTRRERWHASGNTTLAAEDARSVWFPQFVDSLRQDVTYAVRSWRGNRFLPSSPLASSPSARAPRRACSGSSIRSLSVHFRSTVLIASCGRQALLFVSDLPRGTGADAGVRERVGWNIDRAYLDWSGGSGALEPADVLEGTGEFFPTLGVRPIRGRMFGPGEPGAGVISHAAWQRHLGGKLSSAIGRVIRVGDRPFTIVGIAPPDFFGVAPGLAPEVFVPIEGRYPEGSPVFTSTTSSWLHLMARLRDDVTPAAAEMMLQTGWPQVLEATTNPGAPPDRKALYLSRRTSLAPGAPGFLACATSLPFRCNC